MSLALYCYAETHTGLPKEGHLSDMSFIYTWKLAFFKTLLQLYHSLQGPARSEPAFNSSLIMSHSP